MIEFKNVCKKYSNLKALDNINLTIPSSSIFGIVGKSGAGKSTLLRTINKLEKIDEGSIIVDGIDIVTLNLRQLREFRKKVAMIFQHFSLMQTKTIYKNIALPPECSGYKKSEIKTKVEELASLVGISDKLNEKPRNLSGGQCQRVAIARALTLNPKILLCDEATSALDPKTTHDILKLLKQIKEKYDITIIMVTHQMEVIKEVCDEIAILNDGILLEVGKTDELFISNNASLKELTNEEEILPKSGINIKIYFPKESSNNALITKMARDLNIDFSIVWGKLERFKENTLGSLIINIDDSELKKQQVIEYLQNRSILFDMIKGDDENA